MAADNLSTDAPLPPGVHAGTGRVMGSDLHVLVVGGDPALVERARRRLDDLEARWSRFRPDSELSRVSGAAGEWTCVSTETWHLLDVMATAWARTGGRCDATVLPALVAAGYDRDLAELPPAPSGPAPAPPARPAGSVTPAVAVPGLSGMELDSDGGRVRLPPGVRLDPGAVAKGFAADLVAAELLDSGARGALVNVGGDLALMGEPVDAAGWTVELALADGPPLRWRLAEGAIATSSSRRRRWSADGEIRHHLIDPATGQPVEHPPATVSIVAAQAWWAEASATAIAVGGADWGATWAPGQRVTGVVETEHGARRRLPGAERFLA